MDMPSPTGHVAHAKHASLPALALKVPAAHAAHVRSALAVAALSMNVPAAHGALTALHAAPSFTSEYCVRPSHAAHWRSAVAEPGADMPWPMGHIAHATPASLPSLALKVPGWHGEHTRLLVVVGAAVAYSPLAQVAMAWHTRSDVAVAAVAMNWLPPHCLCALHSRSLLADGLAV